METAQMLAMIGREVTLLVPGDHLLPMLDKEISSFALKQLKKFGVNVLMNAEITGDLPDGVKAGKHDVKCAFVINSEFRKIRTANDE